MTSFDKLPDYTGENSYDDSQRILTVKEMDSDSQPREKAMAHGIGSLTNSELFAIILRTGTVGMPITRLCENLMQSHANQIHNLERGCREQFECIDGIGKAKALQIEAVMELIRRYNQEKIQDLKVIRSALDIYEYIGPHMGNLPHEEMWAIYLSRANKILARQRISQGSAVGTVFDIKKIMRMALYAKAEGIVICHNHPSGNLRPSGPDDMITRKMKAACDAMDIRLLDHLIVTSFGYFSYSDSTSLL